jgi:glycosyltransferase involved in cell wall biosynthesis
MTPGPLRVLLVDPSLFTAPYDAALTQGLLDAGVEPTWAVRPIRPGDREELPRRYVEPFFYRWVERATWLPRQLRGVAKGFAHAWGLLRLIARAVQTRPDVVHFQWTVVPPLDSLAIWVLRHLAPVVLTVHDTVPFNGQRMSAWQSLGFDLPIKLSDRVIVHTKAGREALIARGVASEKLAVIPHGPLSLPVAPTPSARGSFDRYTFVMFGEIKPYKGCDVAIEALGLLPTLLRKQTKLVIAGRPRMELSPLLERIHELGLSSVVEVRAFRHTEQQMADLFSEADCFVMPYRQIDASGVYFLVKSLGKWLIASNVGVFAEDLREGSQGWLLPPGNAEPLALAIARAIVERPQAISVEPGSAWSAIGEATRELYQQLVEEEEEEAELETGAIEGEEIG